MLRIIVPSALALLIAGCASRQPDVAVAALPAYAAPMPRPPAGASTALALPMPGPDGRFATPNRGLSAAGTVWHLRAALNVAALRCGGQDGGVAADYNRVLRAQRQTFAAAHTALMGEYRARGGDWHDMFDDAMTRLYNFYSQPPVSARFCDAAVPVLAQAVDVAPASFRGFAAQMLPVVDAPFEAFYADYHRYRLALANWREGGAGTQIAPRLEVDPAVFTMSDVVTAGR